MSLPKAQFMQMQEQQKRLSLKNKHLLVVKW